MEKSILCVLAALIAAEGAAEIPPHNPIIGAWCAAVAAGLGAANQMRLLKCPTIDWRLLIGETVVSGALGWGAYAALSWKYRLDDVRPLVFVAIAVGLGGGRLAAAVGDRTVSIVRNFRLSFTPKQTEDKGGPDDAENE